jgi:hypothetical protein
MQHVTATGAALAGVLVPLAAGVMMAKMAGADPMAPVNSLIAHGGKRVGVPPSQWRGCRGYRLLRLDRGHRRGSRLSLGPGRGSRLWPVRAGEPPVHPAPRAQHLPPSP